MIPVISTIKMLIIDYDADLIFGMAIPSTTFCWKKSNSTKKTYYGSTSVIKKVYYFVYYTKYANWIFVQILFLYTITLI